MSCPKVTSRCVIMVSSAPATVPVWHTCVSSLSSRSRMNLHWKKNPRPVINRQTACYVPPVAKLCKNRKSFPPMNASLPDLPSPCLACCELEGANLDVSAPLFASRLSVPTRFSPSLLLAFDGGYCYNLFGSTSVLLGSLARFSAYFPNSAVGFSA